MLKVYTLLYSKSSESVILFHRRSFINWGERFVDPKFRDPKAFKLDEILETRANVFYPGDGCPVNKGNWALSGGKIRDNNPFTELYQETGLQLYDYQGRVRVFDGRGVIGNFTISLVDVSQDQLQQWVDAANGKFQEAQKYRTVLKNKFEEKTVPEMKDWVEDNLPPLISDEFDSAVLLSFDEAENRLRAERDRADWFLQVLLMVRNN